MSDGIPKLREIQVVRVWQSRLLKGQELLSENGDALEIIYPGRLSDDRGADFCEAVISLNGQMLKGDVEIHIRSGGWRDHNHHLDPLYNRVILHVVMWPGGSPVTRLQNGGEIPVLTLSKYLEIPTEQPVEPASFEPHSNPPCLAAADRINPEALARLLDEAGDERFFQKEAGFREEIERTTPSQSLYRGVMGALGYSRNKLPFLELAGRLPLSVLESPADRGLTGSESLTRNLALLLGTAGFLEGHSRELLSKAGYESGFIKKLESIWVSISRGRPMSPDEWRFFKVRPANSPLRRIAAMSHLLHRYREPGLLQGLLGLITEIPEGQDNSSPEKGLIMNGAINKTGPSGSVSASPPLLGQARAADIITNILLPFSSAPGRTISSPEQDGLALELYRHYKGTALNSVEKHMAGKLGLKTAMIKTARRQQGLIHIYASRCRRDYCSGCPLAQTEAGGDIEVQTVRSASLESEITASGDHSRVIGA